MINLEITTPTSNTMKVVFDLEQFINHNTSEIDILEESELMGQLLYDRFIKIKQEKIQENNQKSTQKSFSTFKNRKNTLFTNTKPIPDLNDISSNNLNKISLSQIIPVLYKIGITNKCDLPCNP